MVKRPKQSGRPVPCGASLGQTIPVHTIHNLNSSSVVTTIRLLRAGKTNDRDFTDDLCLVPTASVGECFFVRALFGTARHSCTGAKPLKIFCNFLRAARDSWKSCKHLARQSTGPEVPVQFRVWGSILKSSMISLSRPKLLLEPLEQWLLTSRNSQTRKSEVSRTAWRLLGTQERAREKMVIENHARKARKPPKSECEAPNPQQGHYFTKPAACQAVLSQQHPEGPHTCYVMRLCTELPRPRTDSIP